MFKVGDLVRIKRDKVVDKENWPSEFGFVRAVRTDNFDNTTRYTVEWFTKGLQHAYTDQSIELIEPAP